MKRHLVFIGGLLLISLVSLAQSGGGKSLDWFSVDNGGGNSSNGRTLYGSIGQPEHGDSSGGEYVLQGGFVAFVNNETVPTNTPTLTPTNTPTATPTPGVITPNGDKGISGNLTEGEVRPVISWATSPDANGATHFVIVIVDSTGQIVANLILDRNNICVGDDCTYALSDDDLPAGLLNGEHDIYIGWVINGVTHYDLEPIHFEVTVPLPIPPQVPLVDSTFARPTIIIPDEAGTTWIQAWIGIPDPLYTAASGWTRKEGNSICDGTICRVLLDIYPPSGNYTLYYQLWGRASRFQQQ